MLTGMSVDAPWASVVIAAHNEASVLPGTLDTLLDDTAPGRIEVVVVANGCTDNTAEAARRAGVQVIDLKTPGKAGALNAGEAVATAFPRAYLDADIAVSSEGLKLLASALRDGTALVAVPDRHVVLTGRPWPVRAYYAINKHLPVFERGLFGRGLIVMSEQGRARFADFPLVVADDLFLDSLFDESERVLVREVRVEVQTPMTTRALVRRLERVRRGAAAVRASGRQQGSWVRPADRWSWLRDVVVPNPRLAPASVVYVVITLWAAARAKFRRPAGVSWDPDDTRRQAKPEVVAGDG